MMLSPFLRTVLKLDAASCLGMAAIVLAASNPLSAAMGVDPVVLRGAAVSLVPIGLFILWLGTRREAPAAFAWLVILGNIGWAVVSVATAVELPGITPLGSALVAGQGLAVVGLAVLEWIGVRQSAALAAA
ncbi:MAG TPA: hypothetical protein VFZ35_02480 [Sphingomicrobium sp.]